jgi:hypothetical protein
VKRTPVVVLGCFALAAGAIAVVASLATGSDPAPVSLPRIPPARAAVTLPGGGLSLARQSGRRVVALSLRRGTSSTRATVTVLDAEGKPVDGLAVRVGDARAAACGHGCYRALIPGSAIGTRLGVHLGASSAPAATVTFDLPARWPVSAAGTLRKTQRALKAAHSVVYRERLESAPGQVISTTWREVAPNRMAYSIAGGSSAVIIGAHRWDRAAGSARWLRSPQDPVSAPALPWGTDVRDVVMLDPPAGRRGKDLRIALFQPSTPAWYDVTLDARTFHLRSVHMTAASHFMRDDYLAYGGGGGIAPPSSR